jgi:hypothetical protein
MARMVLKGPIQADSVSNISVDFTFSKATFLSDFLKYSRHIVRIKRSLQISSSAATCSSEVFVKA